MNMIRIMTRQSLRYNFLVQSENKCRGMMNNFKSPNKIYNHYFVDIIKMEMD